MTEMNYYEIKIDYMRSIITVLIHNKVILKFKCFVYVL